MVSGAPRCAAMQLAGRNANVLWVATFNRPEVLCARHQHPRLTSPTCSVRLQFSMPPRAAVR